MVFWPTDPQACLAGACTASTYRDRAAPRLISSLAIPASGGPAPHQAPEPSDHGEQESQHGGQQERDPKRLVPMAAEVADFHVLAVFEDEDQQQQQDNGK
jgi:hypothetical protein